MTVLRCSGALVLLCGAGVLGAHVLARTPQDPEQRVRAELAAARQMPPALAAKVQPVIDQVWSGFEPAAAMAQVEFAAKYWRLPGNEGYDATLDRVQQRLLAAGLKNITVETAATPSPAWDHSGAQRGRLRA